MNQNEKSRHAQPRMTAGVRNLLLRTIFGPALTGVKWLWRLATGRVCPICLRSVYLDQGVCTVRDQRTGRRRIAHKLCIPAYQRPAVVTPDSWRLRQMDHAAEQQALDVLSEN